MNVKTLAASAAVDLVSADPETATGGIRLLMECSTSIMLNDRGTAADRFRERDRQAVLPNATLSALVALLRPKDDRFQHEKDKDKDAWLDVRVHASRAVFNMSAARGVRNFMSNKAGAIPLLVACLLPEHPVLVNSTQGGPVQENTENTTTLGLGLENTTSTSSSVEDPAAAAFSPPPTRTEQLAALSSNALGALANFAVSSSGKRAIVKAGALAPIVSTLEHTRKTNARQHACRALFALASDSSNEQAIRYAIVQAGALRPLIQSLRHASSHVQWHAAGALANLALDSRNKLRIMAKGGLEALVELARQSTSDKVQRQIARGLFALTCKVEVRGRLVSAGGLRPLVRLLGSRHKDLRRDAAGALGNVAMSSELKERVVDAGALPPLVELAKCSIDIDVLREVVRSLYILSYGESIRRKIVDADGLGALVALAQGGDRNGGIASPTATRLMSTPMMGPSSPKEAKFTDIQEKAAGCLANIACGKGNKHRVVRAGGLPPLMKLLASGTTIPPTTNNGGSNSSNLVDGDDQFNAQRQAARALFALASNRDNQGIIVGMGLSPLIAALLSVDTSVAQYAAGAVANLATGEFQGSIVADGGVGALLQLARSSSLDVQTQAIRGLRNLFGEQGEQHGNNGTKVKMTSRIQRFGGGGETLGETVGQGLDGGAGGDGNESKYSAATTTATGQDEAELAYDFRKTWSGTRLSFGGRTVAERYSARLRSVQSGPDALACEEKRMSRDMRKAFFAETFTDLKMVVETCTDAGAAAVAARVPAEGKCGSDARNNKNNDDKAVKIAEIRAHWAVLAACCEHFTELAVSAAQGDAASTAAGEGRSGSVSLRQGSRGQRDSNIGSDQAGGASFPEEVVLRADKVLPPRNGPRAEEDEAEDDDDALLQQTLVDAKAWQAFVEFAYTGEIRSPFERVLEFYSDRKKRRRGESTKEEIRATVKLCLQMAPALRRMSTRFGMRGMHVYLERCTRVAQKFIRRRASSSSSSSSLRDVSVSSEASSGSRKTAGGGKEIDEDGSSSSSSSSLGRLLKYTWGKSSADVIFCTGDGSCMPAHRVVVCARSSYFRAMLSEEGSFAESHMDTVPVQVDSGGVFSHVLNYIYTGKASTLEPDTSFDVLNAAHMYGLAGLQALCEDHIARHYLEAENVCEILNATSELPECRLRLNSIAFLLTHVVEVVAAAARTSRNEYGRGSSGKEADDSLAEVLRDTEQCWTDEEKEARVRGAIESLPIADPALLEMIIERAVAWGVVQELVASRGEIGGRGEEASGGGGASEEDEGPKFIDLSDPRFAEVGTRK